MFIMNSLKKVILIGIFLTFMSVFVLGQEVKLQITTIGDPYEANENISIKVTLLDLENKPIDSKIPLLIEDVEKKVKIEKEVNSNKIESISLNENAPSGFWTISAFYERQEAKTSFLIEANEIAEFSIEKNVLIIKNIGNTRYEKSIQIIIGDTVGIKKPSLDIGESITFRLVAPSGEYSIKVTDGTTSLVKGNVRLTGESIGILDDRITKHTPITGVGRENLETGSFFKQNQFIYIFVLGIFGATILLAIERYYRKKARY